MGTTQQLPLLDSQWPVARRRSPWCRAPEWQLIQRGSGRAFDFMAKYGIRGVIGAGRVSVAFRSRSGSASGSLRVVLRC